MAKQKLVIETEDRIQIWMTRIIETASSAIGWEGLPDTIDLVYLEKLLTCNGSAIIVYDKTLDKYLVGQNASTGALDIYGYPTDRSVIFRNGTQAFYSIEDSVIIYNNVMRSGELWIYEVFANDLANIDMAVRVNINSQKTMPIIPSSTQQALSAKNLYHDIEENQGYRIIDENSMDVEKFKAALQFDNRKSFTSDNMIGVQREIWNRLLTIVGVNNPNVEKRERVNVQETNSNLQEVIAMRRNRINARTEGCKLMKMQWGLDVKAGYYGELGGENSGSLYDTDTEYTGAVLPG